MKPDIPNKLYYAISEVAEMTDVKAHVLRYWETEFPTLRPKKTRNGSRRYRQKDIDEVLAIKSLLYEEGFKIAGARRMRREQRKAAKAPEAEAAPPQMALGFDHLSDPERLAHVRRELAQVLELVRALGPGEKPRAGTVKPLKAKRGQG